MTSLTESNAKVSRAQEKLAEFKESLENLQADLQGIESATTREKATQALTQLRLRIDQAELSLKEVKTQNQIALQDLDARLRAVAVENKNLIEQQTN